MRIDNDGNVKYTICSCGQMCQKNKAGTKGRETGDCGVCSFIRRVSKDRAHEGKLEQTLEGSKRPFAVSFQPSASSAG